MNEGMRNWNGTALGLQTVLRGWAKPCRDVEEGSGEKPNWDGHRIKIFDWFWV